jgi:MFS family permease
LPTVPERQQQIDPTEAATPAHLALPADRSTERLRTFESLYDRNFRWFFASLLGNFSSMNMQMFIRGWLVYELTGSFAALGIMSLANGVSGLLMALVGGVIADRVRQKKYVVQVGQVLNALAALGVGALIATGELVFAHLVIAALIQGAIMSTIMPARQALTPDVVGMTRLMNAVALNTSGMNAARLLMPGLAGWMVAALGGGHGDIAPAQYVYFAMSLLYVWSVVALVPVVVEDQRRAEEPRPAWSEMVDGFRYIGNSPVIRMLLIANFFMVLFSMTYFMLLPGFAKEVLDAGPGRLGLLTSLSGVGSLVGSLIIASLPSRRRGLVLLLSALLLGVGLTAFAVSSSYWISAGILVVVGLGQAGRMSLSNVLIQSYVSDEYRGRVMSVYMMEFSLMSVGIFLIGLAASVVGPQIAVGASAHALVAMTIGLLLFSPRYRELQ